MRKFRRFCKRESDLANEICETIEALMRGEEPGNYHPYEDTQLAKVQTRLMQYHRIVRESEQQNRADRQRLQELLSDISHQVKTPLANIRMFMNILQERELPVQKQREFLSTMNGQVDKLDFLMYSLIKMSRLESGTFAVNMEEQTVYETIAEALNGVFAKAQMKNIQIEAQCDTDLTAYHDPRWTAEALGNILDNAVKYTPEGGQIRIRALPWQLYTRIEIEDTGIGIREEHYHDVFKRFYRSQENAGEEGIGLGLYLARCIVSRQEGYISVRSQVGKGTVFSVFLVAHGAGRNRRMDQEALF